MRIELSKFGEPVLAGAITGRRLLGILLSKIGEDPFTPETIYLDFKGVDVATASFLRECVIEFRDSVRKRFANYYPVVANANELVVEELAVVLASTRKALMICCLDEAGGPKDPRLIGYLDPKQRVAYDLVRKFGETDAKTLMNESKQKDKVGTTAWNNRLASLSRDGLVIELNMGRAKRYQPIFWSN